MKKLISLILALALVMGLAVGASATTVNITAPDYGEGDDITQVTYTAYKVFSGSFSGEGDANKVYTIKSTDPFYSVVSSANNLFTLTAVPGTDNEWYVTAAEGATGEAIATALNAATNKGTGIPFAYGEGSYTANITDAGYYLIVSSFGSGLIVDTVGSNTVTLEPKNTFPSLTKTADKPTAAFGEEVTYTVTVTIPATANAAIVVHDTMTNLTYVADSASAVVGNSSVPVSAAESEQCDCTMEFTLSEDVVKANADKNVVITYKATVEGDKSKANNEAYLTYSEFTSTKVETEVKNYKIDVFKYTNGANEVKEGLADAGFVLKNSENKYYKLDETNKTISWVDSIDSATVNTSSSNGIVPSFAGLANGEYTLEEKTVPAGYNKANDVKVEIKDADKTGTTKVEVLNQTGSKLPSTGGIGTTLFYVIGGLLMAGAAVLLITKKRMA